MGPVVTATGQHRGHLITYTAGGWRYTDNVVIESAERPCVHCGVAAPNFDAPDPCIGYLPGVRSACCGHGVTEPYEVTDE